MNNDEPAKDLAEAHREIKRLRGLIADERIACAKIADEYVEKHLNEIADGACGYLCRLIADEIRTRPIVTY